MNFAVISEFEGKEEAALCFNQTSITANTTTTKR